MWVDAMGFVCLLFLRCCGTLFRILWKAFWNDSAFVQNSSGSIELDVALSWFSFLLVYCCFCFYPSCLEFFRDCLNRQLFLRFLKILSVAQFWRRSAIRRPSGIRSNVPNPQGTKHKLRKDPHLVNVKWKPSNRSATVGFFSFLFFFLYINQDGNCVVSFWSLSTPFRLNIAI